LESASLERVALAISAFRSDDAVIRLLGKVFTGDHPRFGAVIVVDSLGRGQIHDAAKSNRWEIHYINAERNLGSAGNLDLRLKTAAGLELDWCFAVNHDGEVDAGKVLELQRLGQSRRKVGAVYPQLVFSHAGGRLDSPRRSFRTYGLIQGRCDSGVTEVAWSSSNCALYNLDAVRDGVGAWPQLWMGYEDLAIGWELQSRGWSQLLSHDVKVTDSYEFRAVRLLGREVHIAAKPSWYSYYQLRNLWLIASQSAGRAVTKASVLRRLIVDVALILLYRDLKAERLRLLFRGLGDGMRGVSGKGPVP
jgi:GT2 family glycosyltransferase